MTSYIEGKPLAEMDSSYFGIGESESSFEESDKMARIQFSKNVSVTVKSAMVRQTKESGRDIDETTERSLSEETELCLRGLAITPFKDTVSGKYYSLIMIGKKRYNELAAAEIQLDFERRRQEAANRMAKDSLSSAERAEKYKRMTYERQLDEQAESESIRMDREYLELMKNRYAEFSSSLFPYKLISTNTAELPPETQTISLGGGLDPFSMLDAGYTLRVWRIALGTSAKFFDSKVKTAESFAAYQVLPPMGAIEKLSVTVGVIYSKTELIRSTVEDAPAITTPFVDVTMSFPRILFSYVTAHAEYRKLSVGAAMYPFFDSWSSVWGIVMEGTYIAKTEYLNQYGNRVVFELGMQFRPSPATVTTIAFRNQNTIALTADFGI